MASPVHSTSTTGTTDTPNGTDQRGATRLATFGAGCFWGVEAAFRAIPGVVDATAGYLGGTQHNPTYEAVCSGRTGHAEVVQVEYHPDRVRYEQLLDAFWEMHDPTTRNRQGWDVGSQYRSAIFFHDPAQEAIAQASQETRQHSSKKRIVTEITAASTFYAAEEYHQRYHEKHGGASCHVPAPGVPAASSDHAQHPQADLRTDAGSPGGAPWRSWLGLFGRG